MKYDRTYCSAIVREGVARIECKVTAGEPYQEKPGERPSLFGAGEVLDLEPGRWSA
ncbi:hypothetical protein [Streptomyces sp. NPDC054797]